jgi:hypothetical protein
LMKKLKNKHYVESLNRIKFMEKPFIWASAAFPNQAEQHERQLSLHRDNPSSRNVLQSVANKNPNECFSHHIHQTLHQATFLVSTLWSKLVNLRGSVIRGVTRECTEDSDRHRARWIAHNAASLTGASAKNDSSC